MGKNKHELKLKPQNQPPYNQSKRGLSKGVKLFLLLAIVAVAVTVWVFTSQSAPQATLETGYPTNVAGITYTDATVSSDGSRVSLPYSFANSSKLVFIDLKLQEPTSEVTFQGRSIPLALYKGGNYLPLVVISTPQQQIISGIRVCEPCGSFSFHIKEGKYLECDACRTRWDIETFAGVSGGCTGYPPPKLSNVVGDKVEIDLSSLPIKILA